MDNTFSGFNPIPQQRIREKLDEYMSRRDYDGVSRHLRYWLEEAKLGRDLRGELMLRNELVGHCRKTGNRDGAIEHGEAALSLIERLELKGAIVEGTTCVNYATALNAFGENAKALTLFERARAIYESDMAIEAGQLGGLYNNMGLTCTALKRFDEAWTLYQKAMDQMAQVPNGALEQAVTGLNIANLIEDQMGMEDGEGRIYEWLDRSLALLDTPDIPHDGYYAFVCEKCAPTFEYYGFFVDAARLKQMAEDIYERT